MKDLIRKSVLAAVWLPAVVLADRVEGWSVDTIPWQTAAPNGTRFALLEGDRTRAGAAFSYAFFIPAGVWDGPHWRGATARVFVARGTLKIGFGHSGDGSKTTSYPAGSYLIVAAGEIDYDGADEDTVIIGAFRPGFASAASDQVGP